MARTAITPQKVTTSGVEPATEPANVDGNSIPAGRVLRVTNGSASAVDVTAVTPGLIDGDLALPDRVVSVAAGATAYLGGHGAVYHQSDGTIHFNYSAVTSVTVAALEL